MEDQHQWEGLTRPIVLRDYHRPRAGVPIDHRLTAIRMRFIGLNPGNNPWRGPR